MTKSTLKTVQICTARLELPLDELLRLARMEFPSQSRIPVTITVWAAALPTVVDDQPCLSICLRYEEEIDTRTEEFLCPR